MNQGVDTLHERLLAAHASADFAALPRLYRMVADRAEESGDIQRACFFLTQAWVFALEAGSPMAGELEARLVVYGCNTG